MANQYETMTADAYNAWGKDFACQRRVPWEELTPLVAYAKKGNRVLDVGCGFGRLCNLLKDIGVSYVGVDQSDEQLRIAREMYHHAEFKKADMADLPFPDASFDIIYCIAALHHLTTNELRAAAMKEMARVVKHGCLIIMTNWNLHGAWAKKQIEKGAWKKAGDSDYLVPLRDAKRKLLGERFYHGFTAEELSVLARGAGLSVEDQYVAKERNFVSIFKKK